MFRKGFIFKKFPFKQIQSDNIRPTFEEISMFSKAIKTEGGGLSSDEDEDFDVDVVIKKLAAGGASVDIAKGDKIRIIKGDF